MWKFVVWTFLLLQFCASVHGHGVGEHKHDDGIAFSVYDWDPTMPQISDTDIFPLSTFKSGITKNSSISLTGKVPVFKKHFDYNLTNVDTEFKETNSILMFGPNLQSKMILHLSYHKHDHSSKPSLQKAIIAAVIAAFVTNFCSVFGIICIPIQRRKCYMFLLTFMVSLGVAALSSTAVMVLIPEALHLEDEESSGLLLENSTIIMITVFIGAICFYALEYIIMVLPSLCIKKNYNSDDGIDLKLAKSDEVLVDDSMEVLNFSQDPLVKTEQKSSGCCACCANESKPIAPVAWMILFGDAMHNMMDGLTIGVTFTQSYKLGITLSISILLEETPHEMGDFAILLSSGFTTKWALIANFLSASTSYVGLAIGLAIGEVPSGVNFVLAITAGFFLYISLSDMLPSLRQDIKRAIEKGENSLVVFGLQNFGFIVGFLCILAVILIEPHVHV